MKVAAYPFKLTGHDFHLWHADLNDYFVMAKSHVTCLSLDERERAAGFQVEFAKARFVTSRILLRLLLANYLKIKPKDVRFVVNVHGKLLLDPVFHQRPLFFNISHSKDRWLFGCNSSADVGVDIQQLSKSVNPCALAKRFFSPAEYANLKALPKSNALTYFHQLWVCKEAMLKALGVGIGYGLDQFSFEQAGSKKNWCFDVEGSDWHVVLLEQFAPFFSAVACSSGPINLRRFNVSTFIMINDHQMVDI